MNWRLFLNIGLIILLLYFIINNLQYAAGRGWYSMSSENFDTYNPVSSIPLTQYPENRDTESKKDMYKAAQKAGLAENLEMKTQLSNEGRDASTRAAYVPSGTDLDTYSNKSSGKGSIGKGIGESLNLPAAPQANMQKEGFDVLKFLDEPEQNYDNTFYLNGTADEVKQYNTYTNNWNTPNFESNVMDLRHFFKRNPSSTFGELLAHLDLELEPTTVDEISGQACFTNDSIANINTVQPDVWKYKNELPMNGGQFIPGVYGFGDNDDLYAVYENKKIRSNNPDVYSCVPNRDGNGKCGPDNDCRNCQDDIRNGMGIPGRKWESRN